MPNYQHCSVSSKSMRVLITRSVCKPAACDQIMLHAIDVLLCLQLHMLVCKQVSPEGLTRGRVEAVTPYYQAGSGDATAPSAAQDVAGRKRRMMV